MLFTFLVLSIFIAIFDIYKSVSICAHSHGVCHTTAHWELFIVLKRNQMQMGTVICESRCLCIFLPMKTWYCEKYQHICEALRYVVYSLRAWSIFFFNSASNSKAMWMQSHYGMFGRYMVISPSTNYNSVPEKSYGS